MVDDSEADPTPFQRMRALASRLSAPARLFRRTLGSSGASVRERLAPIDEDYVEEQAQTISDSDLETVVENADAIEERFRRHGPLRQILEDGRLLLHLVKDVRSGRYPQVPYWILSAAGFALLYVLNPFDLVPDALPVLGLLDDAAVVSACYKLLEQDLHDYRRWRQTHDVDGRARPDRPEDTISG
jgi:uncharacterized membrane protein YkvA (DUF1232 family)